MEKNNYKTQPAMKLVKNGMSLVLTLAVAMGIGIEPTKAQSCSGPVSLPYFQDWESGNSLSDYPCWAQKYGGSSSFDNAEIDDGQFNVGGAFSGQNTLMLNDGADAISPEITQLPSGNIEMTFYLSAENFYDEPFEIGVVDQQPSSPTSSYNNYVTYQKFTYVNSSPNTSNFEFTNDETYRKYTIQFDNTSKIGSKKYIVFNRDNSTFGETGIEDVNIKLLLKRDLSAQSTNLSTSCDFSANEDVTVVFKQNGTQTITQGTSIPVSYEVNSNTVNETVTLSKDVAQGDTFSYTFSNQADFSQNNNGYTLSAYTTWSKDQNNSNDSLSKRFRNAFTPPDPTVTGDSVCSGNNATLSVNASGVPSSVEFNWYPSLTTDSAIKTATSFTKANLTQNDTFYAERVDTPKGFPIKVTEIERGLDFVEIQNVSSKSVNVDNHYVVTNNSQNNVNDVEDYWPLSGTLAGGEVSVAGDGGSPWANTNNLPWVSGDNVWVMILDPNGKVVDFVSTGWSFSEYSNFSVTVTDKNFTITQNDLRGEWSGSGAATGSGVSARRGTTDNNDASDWDNLNNNSENATNPNLTVPFNIGLGCASSRVVGVMNARPNPEAGFQSSASTVCALDSVQFQDTSSFTGPGTLSYNWDFGIDKPTVASPKVQFPQSDGQFRVQQAVQSDFGCVDTAVQKVDVNARPEPAIADIEACAGKQTQLRDSTRFPGFGDLNYQWTVQNSTYQSVNPVHTFSASATNEVELAVTSDKGCTDTVTQQADILPTPDVQYSVSDACAGDQVQFNDNTGFGGSVSNLTYNWSFGDRSGSTNPSATHTYDTLGDYNTRLIVRSDDGCVDTANRQVTINGLPDPDFTFENTCDPKAVDLTNTTKFGGDAANLDYTWDLEGNSVNVEEATYTFSNAQTYQVELQATNTNGNCVNTITQDVDVKPQPTADFSVSDVCVGEEANFNYTGNNPAPSYSWDLATTTSTMENPAVTYDQPGSYDVSLTVNYYDGECVKDTTQTLAVNPVPTADFAFGTEGAVCAGEEVQFVNNTTFENGDANTLTYDWAVGSTGLSGESPVFPFDNEGTFDVELTARSTEGCESTFSLTKVVNPLPVSDFTLDKVGPDEVRLSAQDNTYLDYTWNLGDSTTVTAPSATYTYDSNGTYNITLMVEDRAGCASSSSQELVLETVGFGDQPEATSSKIEAYPNPFQDVARINYSVEQQADVQLEVYTANGQNLVTETYNDRPAGSYSFNLKADRSLPTGATYLIRLQIGDKVYTKELIQQR